MESKLFTPYKLGPVTLRNRTIRSAAFESMGKDFGPTQQLKDYHVAVARGGIGMTTLAYAAVCRSGLSFNKQLWLRPEIVPGLRDITARPSTAKGAAAAIQIGHCGNMTHWTTAGQMPIGASSGVNLYAYTPRARDAPQRNRTGRQGVRTRSTYRPRRPDSTPWRSTPGTVISSRSSSRPTPTTGMTSTAVRSKTGCDSCGCVSGRLSRAARACNMAITVKHNMYDGFKRGFRSPKASKSQRSSSRSASTESSSPAGSSPKPRWPSCAG